LSIEDDVAFLEKVPTFAVLGRPALRILAIGAEGKVVVAGEVLFRAGDAAEAGFVIQRGSFSLKPDTHDGDQYLSTAGPGVLLGEFSLFTETSWTSTAVAASNSSVLRIPRSLFLKMLEGFPDAASQLRSLLANRVSRTANEIARIRDVFADKPEE
jgi:CRP-like cAMP-binding protein